MSPRANRAVRVVGASTFLVVAIATIVLIAFGVAGVLALLVPAALALVVCTVDAAVSRPPGVVVFGSRAFYVELGRALYGRDVEESGALLGFVRH